MPNAMDYTSQRMLDPTKKKPKVSGLATPRFNPTSIFAGRPTDSIADSDTILESGLAGLTTNPAPNPYSSLFLFKHRR